MTGPIPPANGGWIGERLPLVLIGLFPLAVLLHNRAAVLPMLVIALVGLWRAIRTGDLTVPLPGPKPEFLFAPTQIAKRTEDWGTDGLNGRVSASWSRFCDWIGMWLELSRARGIDGVVEVYTEVLGGAVDPKVGFICSWE